MNPQRFYNHTNFINCVYAVDLGIMNHFSNMLTNGDMSRVIYAPNSHAMRLRSDNNDGKLNLPFINFKLDGYSKGDDLRWNARAKLGGVYIPELGAKLVVSPINLSYEASMWLERTDDTMYAIAESFFDADNKTIIRAPVNVDGKAVDLAAWLNYSGPDLTVQYDESDWLERNQIQTIGLNFEIETFALRGNFDIAITEEVLFNFASYHSDIENPSYEAAYQLFVNHVNETVSETPE